MLFSCIAVGYPYLTDFMPKSGKLLLEAQPLVWVIGFALLFELAAGFNSHIVSMSKYHRFNIYVMLFWRFLPRVSAFISSIKPRFRNSGNFYFLHRFIDDFNLTEIAVQLLSIQGFSFYDRNVLQRYFNFGHFLGDCFT